MVRTKSQFSRNVYAIPDRIWCNKHLRHTTTEKYDNNGKVLYFRFDDDNMSYKYILSITWTEKRQKIKRQNKRKPIFKFMQNNDIGMTKNKVKHYIMLVWRQGMFLWLVWITYIYIYIYKLKKYHIPCECNGERWVVALSNGPVVCQSTGCITQNAVILTRNVNSLWPSDAIWR